MDGTALVGIIKAISLMMSTSSSMHMCLHNALTDYMPAKDCNFHTLSFHFCAREQYALSLWLTICIQAGFHREKGFRGGIMKILLINIYELIIIHSSRVLAIEQMSVYPLDTL